MADQKRTVEIIFEGVDNVGKTTKGIAASLDKFNEQIGQVVDPLANVGKSVLLADAALIGLAAGGLAIAGKAAGDFGAIFNNLTTLFSASPVEINKFREDIKAYASDSKFSLEQIGAGLEFAIGSGVKYSKSLEVLAIAEQVAIGGNTDLDSSLRLLVGSMNAYGAGTDQAQKFADTFFVTVRNGVITMPELAKQIADVTAIAATSDIPIETLGAAIAALTGAGIQAPQAMTALKTSIIALSAPTGETKKAAAELGVEIGAAAIKSQGFEVVLKKLYDAAGGNIEVLRKIITNVESIAGVMVLGADKSGQFATALKDMGDKTGATAEAYKKMADNIGLINQQMSNNIKLLMIEIGEKLLDGYGNIAGGVKNIFQKLTAEVKAGTFDGIIKTIQELAGKMATELEKLAANLPAALKGVDFSALILSLKSLGASASTAFSAMFGGVDLTTADGLRVAIQKIVNAFESFTNVSAGVMKGLTPLIWAVEKLATGFSNLAPEVQEALGGIFGAAIGLQAALLPLEAMGIVLGVAGYSLRGFAASYLFLSTGVTATTATFANFVAGLLIIPAAMAAAAAAGGALGLALQRHSTIYNSLIQSIADYGAKLLGLVDFEAEVNKLRSAGTNLTKAQIEAFKARNAALLATPKEVATKLTLKPADPTLLKKFIDDNKNWKVEVGIKTKIDKPSIDLSRQELLSFKVNGEQRWMTVPIKTEVDKASLEDTKKKLTEEQLFKRYEVEVHADVDKFKAQADLAGKAFQFRATVDIANIQANSKVIETLAQGWSKVWETSSGVISSTLDMFDGVSEWGQHHKDLMGIINDELSLKRQALEEQKKLNKAQVEYMEAKTRKINSGDTSIKISSDGMEPEVEAFMWKILGKIQIRAAAEQAEFLLGLPT